MIPVAAPTRVASRLASAAPGPRHVLHASATAVYVDLDGWCLGLVSAAATRVPCALWSTLDDLAPMAGRSAVVRDGALVIGDEALRITRLTDPRVTRVGRHDGWSPARPGAMTSRLDDLDLPADGHLTPAHLDRLIGRGPGLTPLGDDVLAGWLVTRAALGEPDEQLASDVRRRLGATTLLSATLLDCAIRGEALPQLSAWLADPTETTARALLAVGATSGAGLMTGAALALTSTEEKSRRAAA
ncbi:DUF2877 domain-containing protein [Nocardioides hwasunensis]|uniref:DUF2877 domain-containing protein n=1 Tax=Nocardioides hwasunensis TaxID=397258 RepID=A0ABR8MHY8_9ACTN|nr:DUF2877 domain-containing protein [Nocardioides hwasunensis]MBD3914377.1 DUF2877 domain-containing protein [Nocardioides hwasunensis]